jgi:flagellar protein FliS
MTSTATRAADVYRKAQVESASPLGLVVMLYDGALRSAAEARAAIERRDVVARTRAISRLLGIVGELRGTLDMERGGEIAASLDQLYAYVSERLVEASFKQAVEPLDEVVRVLTPLRDGWVRLSNLPPDPR